MACSEKTILGCSGALGIFVIGVFNYSHLQEFFANPDNIGSLGVAGVATVIFGVVYWALSKNDHVTTTHYPQGSRVSSPDEPSLGNYFSYNQAPDQSGKESSNLQYLQLPGGSNNSKAVGPHISRIVGDIFMGPNDVPDPDVYDVD